MEWRASVTNSTRECHVHLLEYSENQGGYNSYKSSWRLQQMCMLTPYGYEERWMLNVHAIDTRGAADRLGCTECRCDLYDVTRDEHGRPLRKGYVGGLFCCYDKTRCRVEQGFDGAAAARKLYMKYTVKWVGWDDGGGVVPVKIYILDVTGSGEGSRCKVEYEVESCGLAGAAAGDCIDNKRTRLIMPRGGDIVYGVSHQHTGGLGAALYGQDGRLLCSSMPVYGEGEEAGDEAGYIVGMSTCYPTPGSVSIADGEVVTLESNYSSARMHTGVMGLFYLLVADKQPSKYQSIASAISGELLQSSYFSWLLVAIGVTAAFAVVARYRQRREKEGYQSLAV